MSDDQNRDRDGARGDRAGLFAETPGGATGRAASAGEGAETSLPTPPALDAEAVAKHRAAKQARIRKRREEIRKIQAAQAVQAEKAGGQPTSARRGGASAEVPATAAPPAPRNKKGSALPALRPDIKPDTPALRAERVEAIRRDLVKRRRRKGGGMLLKLMAFVVVPTFLVAWFLWFEASDMYKSESKFVVQSADGMSGGGGGLLGSFLGSGGGGGSSMFDPVKVQAFITSRDVLERLDADHAWIAHFQDPDLDFWHRLAPDATFEEAFVHFVSMTAVSYDPTEGILEMTLVAADPISARRFSDAIILYAEQFVDDLSDRIRADTLRDADTNLIEAQGELTAAQLAMTEVQEQKEIFAVEPEVSAKYGLIATLEAELARIEARMTNIEQVAGGNDPRVQRLRQQSRTLRAQIATQRAQIAGGGAQQETLAQAGAAMMTARLNVETATMKFTAALEQQQMARSNAAKQHRYLQTVASPSMPDEANYPKKPEMTALAFLAFLSFYIVVSLTMSLIREQASI